MLDPFTLGNSPQNLGDFILAIARSQHGDVLSYDLIRRVTVNALGSLIPTGNNAVQILAYDGVVGGIDNQGQAGPVFSQLLGRSAMEFFVRPAQFLCDPLAVADVADRTQDERSLIGEDGAETDFNGKFRAVATSSGEIQIRSHAARLGRFREALAMPVMLGAMALGHEHFDLLADQFSAGIAK